MLTFGTQYANRAFAPIAAANWDADTGSIEHISDSGNSVYRFQCGGIPAILRLTDPDYRSWEENEAELRFVRHLAASGVHVAEPILSINNAWVEEVKHGDTILLASAFTVAPGERIASDSPLWGESFFRDWGQAIGKIHQAAKTFPRKEAEGRWLWHDEVFFREAHRLIPAHDVESLQELEVVCKHLDELPNNAELFGMTHADFGPQNFHFSSTHGITAFDFGNCCRHWFISDLAIAATLFRNHPNRKEIRAIIIAGYREVCALDKEMLEEIGWFIRLRALYVYLSRLMKFGSNPTPQEKKIVEHLRTWVHLQDGW